MKLNLWLIPMLSICFLLISATTTKIQTEAIASGNSNVTEAPLSPNTFTTSKLNFFQRTLLKLYTKKYKRSSSGDAIAMPVLH